MRYMAMHRLPLAMFQDEKLQAWRMHIPDVS